MTEAGAQLGPYQDIDVETTEAGVFRLSLNRPERLNALTYEMLHEVKDALARANVDPDVRCIVLPGPWPGILRRRQHQGPGRPWLGLRSIQPLPPLRLCQRHQGDPLDAEAGHRQDPGHAMGAGLELALSTDVRIVARDATLGIPFISIGATGATYQLARMIGPTRTLELLFTARRLSGDEALDFGIATRAVAASELEECTNDWAERLSVLPTRVMGLMKRAVYRASEQSLQEGLEESAVNALIAQFLADRSEGAAAWRENRPPRFTNQLRSPVVDATEAR